MKNKEIAEMIAREAADAEAQEAAGQTPDGPYHRPRPAKDPSEVYSVRMPISRLEQLRQIAEQERTNPSTLIRKWVLDRLDQKGQDQVVDTRMRRAVRLELERAGLIQKAS
ncbi:MAG: hypothetical protein ACREN8_05940 [Candidatus Dormibacteraceae bacterium]